MGLSHKNNRRKGGKKVKRVRKANRLLKSFATPELAKVWDRLSSGHINYQRLGLKGTLNDERAIINAVGKDVVAALADAPVQIPEPLTRSLARPDHFMKPTEVAYLHALREKHGSNFKAMERDMKLNYLQHTEAHLKTRTERMDRYVAEGGAGAGDGSAGIGAGFRATA